MKVRKKPTIGETTEELRAKARSMLDAAEPAARRVLEEAGNQAEPLERQADELELASRAEGKRSELTNEAMAAAQDARDCRVAAGEHLAEAEAHSRRRLELEAELAAAEAEIVRRRDAVEEATAVGDLPRALELEQSLGEPEMSKLRAAIATAEAAETRARDAAAALDAQAEQSASAATAQRRAIEQIEVELRAEYEARRVARAQARALALSVFDLRRLAWATAAVAAAAEPTKPETAPIWLGRPDLVYDAASGLYVGDDGVVWNPKTGALARFK